MNKLEEEVKAFNKARKEYWEAREAMETSRKAYVAADEALTAARGDKS